jgi:hypothetical protein
MARYFCAKTVCIAQRVPLDALTYVCGKVLAKVEIKGKIIEGGDKEVSSDMRIIEAYEWQQKDSVALSIFAAELVLKNYENLYPDDDRPRKAIEATKAYLADPSEKNRSAAESAARSAALKRINKWIIDHMKDYAN